MTERERFVREMELQSDGTVPSHVGITYPVWKQYGTRLDWLEKFSSHVRVGISRQPGRAAYSEVTDIWGCRWVYPLEALDGQCIGHPVANWSDLKRYRPPNPEAFTDWKAAKGGFDRARAEGTVARGGTDHGFIFLRLQYLRGFENSMLDYAEGRPELADLIGIVGDYWFEVARRWVEAGAELVSFGDDLGAQDRLPISPSAWRKYIKPTYRRIFQYCRSHGVYVHLHTDGYIVDIIPDLIECGVSILNPQELVNGVPKLRKLAFGKLFIDLDIDRQSTTVFGAPEDCDAHILECAKMLGSPGGGLSFIWGVYPGTPYQNIEAVVRAMDRYAGYWSHQ